MNYDISTTMGRTLRSTTKPVLNERGNYFYTDANGQVHEINRARVRKIEAVRPGESPKFSFD